MLMGKNILLGVSSSIAIRPASASRAILVLIMSLLPFRVEAVTPER